MHAVHVQRPQSSQCFGDYPCGAPCPARLPSRKVSQGQPRFDEQKTNAAVPTLLLCLLSHAHRIVVYEYPFQPMVIGLSGSKKASYFWRSVLRNPNVILAPPRGEQRRGNFTVFALCVLCPKSRSHHIICVQMKKINVRASVSARVGPFHNHNLHAPLFPSIAYIRERLAGRVANRA